MERLTERYVLNDEKKGIAGIKVFESENKIPLVKVLSGEYLYPAIEKLAAYEDLEEQGLLVRLPCKVGDTMYDIVGKPLRIVEHKVDAFHIDKKGFHLQIINGVLEKKQEAKVYFSREEAEKKLEEMKKNG